MYFLAYAVNLVIFFVIMGRFVGQVRCFKKEPNESYAANVGLDFDASLIDYIGCYLHWMFTSWLLLVIIAAGILIVFLRNDRANPAKVTFRFIIFNFICFLLFAFMTVRYAHENFVAG